MNHPQAKSNVCFCLILLLVGANVAGAQDPCADTTGTWFNCLIHMTNQADDAEIDKRIKIKVEEAAADEMSAASERQKFGVWQALAGAATSSEVNLEDFLSSLLTNLDLDGLENGDDGLRFKKNVQLTYGTLAVAVQAKQLELFPEIKMKLDELDQGDTEKDLEEEISNLDSVDVSIAFSLDRFGKDKAIWWGRRYRTTSGAPTGYAKVGGTVFEMITEDAATSAAASTRKEMKQALGDLEIAIKRAERNFQKAEEQRAKEDGPKNQKPVEVEGNELLIGTTPEADAKAIRASIDRFVAAAVVDFKDFNENLKEKRYYAFSDLVANQPQFVLEGNYSFRDELVGRNSWGASVKYEVGQANVNGLRRFCKTRGLDLACYQDFLKEQDKALKKNWRTSFQGTYSWSDDYNYMSPEETVSVSLDSSQSWDLSLSAGRSLQLDDDNHEVNRIDLEAKYEDVTGDTMKQARFVSTLNFTQRLNKEGLSFSAGLVYANRPEYRGEVDEELSARAGLKFALKPPKSSK